MKKLFPVLFLLLSQSLIAQKPCSLPVFRQFDFWVGNWEAFEQMEKKQEIARSVSCLTAA